MSKGRRLLGLLIFFFLSFPALKVHSADVEETPQSLLGLDPELTQTPPPKLVLPQEPPANVRLSEVVVKADEWKGAQCAVQEPRFAVFRHADKWTTFWDKALAPFSPKLSKAPGVDFAKDMVVGVFMGEKDYPNFDVEIRSIRRETQPGQGEAVVVRYREVKRMAGVFMPSFAIQPFHLKKVPAFSGSVVFLKVRR